MDWTYSAIMGVAIAADLVPSAPILMRPDERKSRLVPSQGLFCERWGGSCTATPGRQCNCRPNGTHNVSPGRVLVAAGSNAAAKRSP